MHQLPALILLTDSLQAAALHQLLLLLLAAAAQ
jgi:hypothetical protein